METLRIAATALGTHKMRSFLTLLGVIIGVMTVVSVVSIIAGLNNFIEEKLFKLSPDVYVVTQFGIITSREQFLEVVKRKPIDWADYEAIRARCQRCDGVGVNENRRDTVKRGSRKLTRVRVQGGTPNMADIGNVDLDAGRFFTEAENSHSASVTIIGTDVRDEVFGKLDPIGRTVWIADHPFKVIGLLRKQGALLGQSQDKQLWMPINAFRKQFGIHSSLDLFVRAKDGVPGMERSVDDIRIILRSRRRTPFRGDDPFSTVSAEALQAVWRQITAGGFALLVFISGISLLVGGIVIMNIMLVSVVERTREIGVRRALGATKRNIRMQFLSEAMLLALGGGAIGVLLGYAISKGIAAAFPLPTLVRPSLVISGLAIAVVTGALAGFMPARRAAALPPIDALRYE
jgi:putative ABC transport system permease protein